MFVCVTMTDGTKTISRERVLPMPRHAVNVEFGQPLVMVVPLFALPINSRRNRGSRSLRVLARWEFIIQPHQLELIVVMNVSHDRMEGCTFEGFLETTKLCKEVVIA